ncbi:MAG TPA: sensor domain-containing diguanylate cyclase [Candidatus Elarobacter sp.]
MGLICALAGGSCMFIPFLGERLPAYPSVLPAVLGVALVANLITGFVLFSQFMTNRLVGTGFLACAYLAVGLSLAGTIGTFPELFGGRTASQLAVWIWVVRNLEFPLLVIVAVAYDRDRRAIPDGAPVRRYTALFVLAAVAIIVLPMIAGSALAGRLPHVAVGAPAGLQQAALGEVVVAVNAAALLLTVVWTRGRTVLQMWLIVALVASVLDVQIAVAANVPFTAGWYLARALVVVSSTSVLFAYLQQMHVLVAKLSDLSMIDGLTALPNRRAFELRLEASFRTAKRANRPLALLLVDVDRFKQYNDSHGHLAGDEALKAVAAQLRVCALRPGDVVARWGGEEFVAVLPETDHEGAYLVAERMRASIAELAIGARRATAGSITVSIGVTLLGGGDDRVHTMMQRVDIALYVAKSRGRNTIAFELPDPEPDRLADPAILFEQRLREQ